MKNNILFTTCFLLLAFLTGCSSYTCLDRNIPEGALVEGEKPIAVFLARNTSYQILGCLKWCSGVNWIDDDMPYEEANECRIDWFDDNVSLDNNIRSLKRACKEVGSNRIAAISHNVFESSTWSFFLVNRKTIKTNCFILEKKPKADASK